MKAFYPILAVLVVFGGQNRIAAQNHQNVNANTNNPAQRRLQQNQSQRPYQGSQAISQASGQAQGAAPPRNPNPSQIHSGDTTSRLPASSAQPKRTIQPAANGQLAQSASTPVGQGRPQTITPANQQRSSAQPAQVETHKRNNIYNIFVPAQPAPNSPADNLPPNTVAQPAAPQERQKNNPSDIVNAVGNVFANILKASSSPAASPPAATPQIVEKPGNAAAPAADLDPKLMAGAFRQLAATQRQKAADSLKNGQDAEGLAALEDAKKYETAAKRLEEPFPQAAPAAANAEEKSAIQQILESDAVKKALDGIGGALNKKTPR
jgi:hypothetical protein